MIPDNYYDQIDDYLNDLLSEKEKTKFEVELRRNPALQEEVKKYHLEKEAIDILIKQEYGTKIRVWSHPIFDKIRTEEVPINNKSTNLTKKRIAILLTVIFLLLIVIIGYFLLAKSKNQTTNKDSTKNNSLLLDQETTQQRDTDTLNIQQTESEQQVQPQPSAFLTIPFFERQLGDTDPNDEFEVIIERPSQDATFKILSSTIDLRISGTLFTLEALKDTLFVEIFKGANNNISSATAWQNAKKQFLVISKKQLNIENLRQEEEEDIIAFEQEKKYPFAFRSLLASNTGIYYFVISIEGYKNKASKILYVGKFRII